MSKLRGLLTSPDIESDQDFGIEVRKIYPALVEVVAAAQALRDESPWFYGDLKKALEKLAAAVASSGDRAAVSDGAALTDAGVGEGG